MKTVKQASKSVLRLVAQPEPTAPLERLVEWDAMAQRAYASNTMRAQKADGAIFQAFCEVNGLAFFPADPKTIRAFIEHCIVEQKKPATIRRYVATIARRDAKQFCQSRQMATL